MLAARCSRQRRRCSRYWQTTSCVMERGSLRLAREFNSWVMFLGSLLHALALDAGLAWFFYVAFYLMAFELP
eukprot:3516810-Pyramimonas_sp.AAC.1